MISSTSVVAQDRHADDDEEPEEEISAIGQKLGLELYESDKSDYCVESGLQIRVTINNVTNEGLLKLELFGEHNFLRKSGKMRKIRVPAENGSQKLCINVPTPGSYAVVGYHDVDGDRRLKKAWNFKPLEPYGLSRNPEIKALRLPKYSETSFDVPLTGTDITINLVDLSK